MPFDGFGELTAGGFGELTTGRLRTFKLPFGGFGELTASKLRTPNCPSASSGHQISPEAKFGGGGGSRTRSPI